jgi:hypothetical protein
VTKEEIVTSVLTTLQIEEGQFEELEIEIKFADGKKVEIEFEGEMLDQGYNGIREFEFSLKLLGDQKLKLKYESEEGKVKAEVEKETEEGNEKYKGEQAVEALESLLDQIALTEDMSEAEILESILAVLEISEEDISELEIEIKFTNGKEVEIEFEGEMLDEGYNGIREFEFSLKLMGDQKLNLKYESEEGKVKAEVEKETEEGKEEYKGEQAVEAVESFLDELALTDEMTEAEILEVILAVLEISEEDIKGLEIEIKFTNDKEIEMEFENEDEEDEDEEDED